MISVLPLTARPDSIDQETVQQLVDAGEILPLEQLLQRHLTDPDDRLLDAELEEEHGHLVYEFEVLGRDSIVREYEVDARSGELLELEIER